LQTLEQLIKNYFGIYIRPDKAVTVEERIRPLLAKHNCINAHELFLKVDSDTTHGIINDIANAVTTNFTYFNREEPHFDFLLKNVYPPLVRELRQKNSLDLRIWCAACSSGEEAYSLAMTIRDYLDMDYSNWRSGVLATDLSTTALEEAIAGIYPSDRMIYLKKDAIKKYFSPINDYTYKIKASLAKEVTFRKFNLKTKTYPFKQRFHIIFCRNVMIYFDLEMINHVVENIYKNLETNGYLFISNTETLGRKNSLFEYIAPGIYRKK